MKTGVCRGGMEIQGAREDEVKVQGFESQSIKETKRLLVCTAVLDWNKITWEQHQLFQLFLRETNT